VDGSHCDGSFADRTGNSFGRGVANVAGGEHAGAARLEWIGLTLQRPVGTGHIAAGQHEAVIVEAEGGGQPVGVGFGAGLDGFHGSLASPSAVWMWIGATELMLLAICLVVLKLVADRWGPERLRGMAGPGEAERLLGRTRLRTVRKVVRPDLYGKNQDK
jgi:hypothetical protein